MRRSSRGTAGAVVAWPALRIGTLALPGSCRSGKALERDRWKHVRMKNPVGDLNRVNAYRRSIQ